MNQFILLIVEFIRFLDTEKLLVYLHYICFSLAQTLKSRLNKKFSMVKWMEELLPLYIYTHINKYWNGSYLFEPLDSCRDKFAPLKTDGNYSKSAFQLPDKVKVFFPLNPMFLAQKVTVSLNRASFSISGCHAGE